MLIVDPTPTHSVGPTQIPSVGRTQTYIVSPIQTPSVGPTQARIVGPTQPPGYFLTHPFFFPQCCHGDAATSSRDWLVLPHGAGQVASPPPSPSLCPGTKRNRRHRASRGRGPLHLVSTLCNTTCGGAGTAHTCAPQQPNEGGTKEGKKKKKKKKKKEKEREKKKGSNLSFESFSLKCSHGFIRICSHRGFEEPGIRSETSGKIRINENIIPKTKGKINPALPLVCSTAFPQLVTLNLLNRLELSFPFSLSLPY